MLIVFQRGIKRVPNSIVSVTRRSDGSGGKRNSFFAVYSLRILFFSVPPSVARAKPFFSAFTIYIAQIAEAGLLIVIEGVTWSRGRHAQSTPISASEETAPPHLPNSPAAIGWSVS